MPGPEHPGRIGETLDPPHHLGGGSPPLPLDERGHVDPGPVLGLQRAVVGVEDHRHQLLHEGLVALDVLGLGEVRGQHEVEVARRGVPGDSAQEPVLGQQRPDLLGRLGDPGGRHADVLDDQRRPRRPQAADQPVQALPDPPVELDRLVVAGELGAAERLAGEPGEHLGGRGLAALEAGGVIGAELDQQRRRFERQLLPMLRGAGDRVGGDHQGRGDHQLDRGRAGGDELADRRGGVGDRVEVDPGERRRGRLRHGLVDDLGDEGERALGADDQAAEDLERLVGVEKRAEAISGRVLDLELAPDPPPQVAVGANLVANLDQARDEVGLGGGEALGGAGGGGVDHRSRRQYERQLADGRVGVRDDPAAHAAGVVGDDPADGGDVGRGRVGAEPAAVGREDPVDVAEHGPGPDPDPAAVVEHLDAAPVPADVGEDPVGLGLPVEAGAAGAKDERGAAAARERHQAGDLRGGPRLHDRGRDPPIGAGVGGVADQIAGTRQQSLIADDGAQLGREPGRRPIRDLRVGTIGRRRGRGLGGDPGSLRRQQRHRHRPARPRPATCPGRRRPRRRRACRSRSAASGRRSAPHRSRPCWAGTP